MDHDSKSSRPQKTPGVLFFNHFPKNFLRPYGRAEGIPSKEKTLSRLQPEGCEWLRRPNIAMSELAATMQGNTDLLKEKADFFTTDNLVSLLKSVDPLLPQLLPFHKDSPERPTEHDSREFLKTILSTSSRQDRLWNTALEVGAALFITAIQYKVAQTLISNPSDYASKITFYPNAEPTFKSSKSLLDLIPLLHEPMSISAQTQSVSRLIEILQSDEPSSSSKPKNPRKTRREDRTLQKPMKNHQRK